MRPPRNNEAAGQVYGFLVAGVIFFGAFGALAWTVRQGGDPAPANQAQQEMDAINLAAILLGDSGSGWASPDSLARLGLAGADGHSIDADHYYLLNNATLDAQSNGLLEYEEAREALGLSGASGFRLSVLPFDYERSMQQHDFSHVKALYIGDFNTLSSITLAVGQGTIANANAQLNTSMGSNTGLERTVVDSIGLDFDNQMHLILGSPQVNVQITTIPPVSSSLLAFLGLTVWDGDVLYDNKQFLDAVLPGKLANGGYDLLILGSGIEHSTLTANSVKNAVDTFVRAGGTMMVFGSPGANFNWMQPIMDLSATSVSGSVTAVDEDHDIISTPYDLDWINYPTNNLGWTIGTPSNFENVLMQGGKPVLAISKDNAIGSGAVILSSVQPRAVAASLGTDEASHFMFNMLLFDRNPTPDPILVFGPDPPTGLPVSSTVRTTVISGSGVDIPVSIELLAWGT